MIMRCAMQFVNFERVEDAKRAFDDKNSVVVPELTGTHPLKMQFKPPKVTDARTIVCVFDVHGNSPVDTAHPTSFLPPHPPSTML